MKKNQIKIHIIDGVGFCSWRGKTGDASGSERPNTINHLYEQMILERLGNKNGQIFYNQ